MSPAAPRAARLGEQSLARAALTYLAEPGDPALGALLAICEPAEVLAAIKADVLPGIGPGCGDSPASRKALERALGRWRARLPALPDGAGIAAACRDGIRLVCPGDPQWPERLDELGRAQPYALWLRGRADLPAACLRSVSMVGSRAATGYGAHVAGEIAADLGDQGWVVVSGGAYGIDAAAHRGALVTKAITIAVLACGVDHPYPAGHADLFADIAAGGLVISEWPPGRHPARLRFLVRNRVIAALTCGTVIVEAGERSGALNTARHAADLGRPLMAVPGPVTSEQSAGCHRIIREWGAACVTCAADIIEMLTPLGVADWMAPAGGPGPVPSPTSGPASREPAPSRDQLDLDSARVLDALPARGAAGPSTIAVEAGVDLDTVLRCLGLLAGCGFIERFDRGWRLRKT
jgi:DNA processing protein